MASNLFSSPEIRCTGICRKLISFLNRSSILHPLASGSFTSSVTAIGLYLFTRSNTSPKAGSHHNLQVHFMRFFDHDLAKTDIIFYHQHHLIAWYDIVPVITDFIDDLVQRFQVFRFSHFDGGHGLNSSVCSSPSASLYSLTFRLLCFSFFTMAGLYSIGRNNVNVLPVPASLSSSMEPPSRSARPRLMESPRPVPPYLRLVEPSACWKASKMIFCLSFEIPIPVSLISNATTCLALSRLGLACLPVVYRLHRSAASLLLFP